MKRLLTIILAALMMFALLATVVWADEVEDDSTLEVEVEPEEPVISEEYVDTTDLTLYSDEIGDYHLYKDGAVKAYVRLNRDAVTAVVENGLIAVYDNNGNYINLDIAFNLSEHLWIEEIADEYARQNTVYDENGMAIEVPEIGIPGYSPSYTGVEVEIEETHEDLFGCEIAVDYEAETDGIPREGYDGSAGTASNPNTGVAVAVTPTVIAAAIAFATKNRGIKMKRLLTIILAALMMCALFATAVFAVEEGCATVEVGEINGDWSGIHDENGHGYQYITGEKYYYFPYEGVDIRIEDGVLHIYGSRGEEIFLCDEFDLAEHPWMQEIIGAYDGEVKIPRYRAGIAGIFGPAVEDEGTVTVVAPQEGKIAFSIDEQV